jgi:hypothetical protein
MDSLLLKYFSIPADYLHHYPDGIHFKVENRLLEANKSNIVNDQQAKKQKTTNLVKGQTLITFFTNKVTASSISKSSITISNQEKSLKNAIVDEVEVVTPRQEVNLLTSLFAEVKGSASSDGYMTVEVDLNDRNTLEVIFASIRTSNYDVEALVLNLKDSLLWKIRFRIFLTVADPYEFKNKIIGDGLCGYRDEYCKFRSAQMKQEKLIVRDVNFSNELDRENFVVYLRAHLFENYRDHYDQIVAFIEKRYNSTLGKCSLHQLEKEWWATENILSGFSVNSYSKLNFVSDPAISRNSNKLQLDHYRSITGKVETIAFTLQTVEDLLEEVKDKDIPVYLQIFQGNHLVQSSFIDLLKNFAVRLIEIDKSNST